MRRPSAASSAAGIFSRAEVGSAETQREAGALRTSEAEGASLSDAADSIQGTGGADAEGGLSGHRTVKANPTAMPIATSTNR